MPPNLSLRPEAVKVYADQKPALLGARAGTTHVCKGPGPPYLKRRPADGHHRPPSAAARERHAAAPRWAPDSGGVDTQGVVQVRQPAAQTNTRHFKGTRATSGHWNQATFSHQAWAGTGFQAIQARLGSRFRQGRKAFGRTHTNWGKPPAGRKALGHA